MLRDLLGPLQPAMIYECGGDQSTALTQCSGPPRETLQHCIDYQEVKPRVSASRKALELALQA